MTMESAHAPHAGRKGAAPTALRRSATSIHPPRRPRAERARPAVRRRRTRRHPGAAPLLAVDVLAALAATAVLPALAGGGADTLAAGPAAAADPLVLAGPVAAGLAVLHARAGLYRPRLAPSALFELPALLGRSAVVWCAAAAAVAAAAPRHALGWAALATAVCLQVVLTCAGRGFVNQLRRRAAVRHPRSTLVVGPLPGARQVAAALQGRQEYGLRPVGLADPGLDPEAATGPLPVLTSHEDVRRAVIQNAVRVAVFTRPPEADERTAALLRLCHDHGCRLWLADAAGTARITGLRASRTSGAADGPAGADHVWGYAAQLLLPRPARPVERAVKRLMDGLLALAALALAAPLMALCAAAVRLADGPGVIFRQERVGLYGRPFTLLKFRTLRADEHESATRWTVAGDRRMSRVGSFLRKSSLDELPQLWNVVRGDMSLVGPRPERPFFVAKFADVHPGYEARHRMPVGITGLAQINGLRGDTSIEDRARFDNHYIDTWSLWQDLWILARTAASFFRFRLGGS
ncbi:exopolysaccharide biosynthesis polyprenyl glycosylphosphotransferase [Streptomyces sp. NRRL S-87]|uniref:exopolysaccharide biosynthesis polyprenyl glycosylphosphotransferase n=1 Tax=Streptomyces sp. NRRL S-87 TaxID=1463920 RepID=UPI0004BEAA54|nr:exopolysaccharide biosynthesis polyprenyl glycosylphosphotransferase [Streptomyces sp. NRRL S-87]